MATLHVGPNDGVGTDGVDGKVGIGTSTPNEKLVVNGDYARIMNKGVTNSAYNALHVQNSDSDGVEMVAYGRAASGSYLGQDRAGAAFYGASPNSCLGVGTRNSTPLAIATSDTERMRITSSGDVGIGTTNPGDKLEVNGNIKANGLKINGSEPANPVAGMLWYDNVSNKLKIRNIANTSWNVMFVNT